jgi:hypothetical protein
VALGFTQILKEMSTRNIPGADKLTPIYEPMSRKCGPVTGITLLSFLTFSLPSLGNTGFVDFVYRPESKYIENVFRFQVRGGKQPLLLVP